MLSAIAQQFSAARTPENFAALSNAEPQVAAQWLSRAATSAGIDAPWKASLDQLLNTAFDQPAAKDTALKGFFTQNQAALAAMDMANLQAARADTLGFTTHTPEPVTMVGTISTGGANATITTAEGTFTLDIPQWPIVQSGVQSQYFEPNVLQSFAGRTATIRAYPTATPGVLAVEEFSPGTNKEFVSGRLSHQDGKVGIRVRPDKWVEITNPDLAAALMNLAQPHSGAWGGTGVILQGPVKQDGAKFTFDGKPDNYWMLCRANGTGSLLAGHGAAHPYTGNATPSGGAGERLLVFGRAESNGSITANGALLTPQVRVENGTAAIRDSAALFKLAPIDLAPVEGGVDKFEP